LKYKVGDLILHNGLLWTIVSREKRKYIVLESGRRSWKLWTYELDHMLKKYPEARYFPVIE
jgi:hypothetical protein